MIETIATFALGAMAGFAVTACLAHVVIREAMSAQLESDMRSLRSALVGQRIAMLDPQAEYNKRMSRVVAMASDQEHQYSPADFEEEYFQ